MLRKKQLVLACCLLAMGGVLLLKEIPDESKKRKRYSRAVVERIKARTANRKRAATHLVESESTSDEEEVDNGPSAAKRLTRGRPFKISVTQPAESESVEEFDVLAEEELKLEEHLDEEQDPFADPEPEIKEEAKDSEAQESEDEATTTEGAQQCADDR